MIKQTKNDRNFGIADKNRNAIINKNEELKTKNKEIIINKTEIKVTKMNCEIKKDLMEEREIDLELQESIPECPKITTGILNKMVEAEIDTGAQMSFVQERFFDEINVDNKEVLVLPVNGVEVVTALKNQRQRVTKQAVLPIQLKQKCIEGIFLVVPNLKSKLIIGCNFLCQYKARINMDRKFIQLQVDDHFIVEDFCSETKENRKDEDNVAKLKLKGLSTKGNSEENLSKERTCLMDNRSDAEMGGSNSVLRGKGAIKLSTKKHVEVKINAKDVTRPNVTKTGGEKEYRDKIARGIRRARGAKNGEISENKINMLQTAINSKVINNKVKNKIVKEESTGVKEIVKIAEIWGKVKQNGRDENLERRMDRRKKMVKVKMKTGLNYEKGEEGKPKIKLK